MNETIQILINRQSCRAYKPDMVEDGKINQVIEAGINAPTGMGRQSPVVIAVTDKKVRDELSKENANFMGKEGFDPFYGAPVVLIVLANKAIPTYKYDGSLCIGNMLNAAYSLGLGSCWIHRAKEEFESDYGHKLLKEIGIDGDYEGIGHVILGYPSEDYKEKAPRKSDYVYKI